METALAQAATARKLSLSLNHVTYSGVLTKELMDHSTECEAIYSELRTLTKQGAKEGAIKARVNKVHAKTAAFEDAEKTAKAMLSNLKPKKGKAKGKARAKPKAEA